MERSGLFSSRSLADLPTYLPTYLPIYLPTHLYVRGLRGLMSPGTLPKIEWLTRADIFGADFEAATRERMCNWPAVRAMRVP